MKELMKICSNVMSSPSKMKALSLSLSRTPMNCRQCLNKRKYSSAQKLYTPMIIHRKFNKIPRSCISSSIVNNHHEGHSWTNTCHKYSTVSANDSNDSGSNFMEFSDEDTKKVLSEDMRVIFDFVTEEEEEALLKEVEPHLKRLRYESSHWDDAIHGYRETERKTWTEKNKTILQRVREAAFPVGVPQIAYVHVLDLQKEGYIKAHVDAVKFCGSTIAGISLLSPCIMRLVHTEDKSKFADILLERRSLYIMKDAARYNYTHEVLPDNSLFRGQTITKDRRISVICRNEP